MITAAHIEGIVSDAAGVDAAVVQAAGVQRAKRACIPVRVARWSSDGRGGAEGDGHATCV